MVVVFRLCFVSLMNKEPHSSDLERKARGIRVLELRIEFFGLYFVSLLNWVLHSINNERKISGSHHEMKIVLVNILHSCEHTFMPAFGGCLSF